MMTQFLKGIIVAFSFNSIIICSSFVILLSSCYAKKQMKAGLQLELNNQYESAYAIYRGVYDEKNHAEAKSAAERMAQAILIQKCSKIDNLTMSGNFEGAKMAHTEAQDYYRQHISEIQNASSLNSSYENWRMKYGAHLAKAAEEALKDGNYTIALDFCSKFQTLGIEATNEHARRVVLTQEIATIAPEFVKGQKLF
ncbi:MAG: hypothetical protein ACKO66_01900, partial [Flavobacteriales bacterium]